MEDRTRIVMNRPPSNPAFEWNVPEPIDNQHVSDARILSCGIAGRAAVPLSSKLPVALVLLLSMAPGLAFAEDAGNDLAISEKTEECLLCHEVLNPGLVADWRASRHARTTPAAALALPENERRMSADEVAEDLRDVVVGCYECHSLNAASHKDNFLHEDVPINVIVSPNDCRTCHPAEAEQYAGSKKAHAVGNLTKNPLYHLLAKTVTSV